MLRLTSKRMARGWSQNRLASAAGITPTDLSRIENRRLIPYPSQLTKLARALGLPDEQAGDLMEDDPPPGSSPAG